jgi:hypothetical protein
MISWEQEDITAAMTKKIILEKEQLGSTEEAEDRRSVFAHPRKRDYEIHNWATLMYS